MFPLYYYSVKFLQCLKPSHPIIPVRYQFKAFLCDPDAARPENPIHSTNGGKQHGFAGALVGGIHVFGWATGAFLKTLDDDWLDRGWAHIAFKRPVYNGDLLDVNTNGPDFTVTNKSGEVCLQGKAGIDLLHHSYHYGPAIHTQSQIQNLAADTAARPVRARGGV